MVTFLIGGGAIDLDFAREQINREPKATIIAVDKGLKACILLGVEPDFVIGDFDSLPMEEEARLDEFERRGIVTRLNPVKDDTDMEAALHLALEKTEGDIVILGGTGTRYDHTTSNVLIMGQALCYNRDIQILDPHNRIRLISESMGQQGFVLKAKEQLGGFVSLIPFGTQVEGLTLEGFKYPLLNATLGGYTSLGISNEITGEYAKISFQRGSLLLIEARD